MRVEINFNICRICLQNTDEDMTSIYDRSSSDKDDADELLYERIERCSGIQVLTDPELPNKICKKCKAFLNIAYKFRTICKSSDDYLRDFVSKSTQDYAIESSTQHNDDGEGVAEYLMDYNPNISNSTTVAHVLQQAGHDINASQTEFDFEEIDQYDELWCDNESDDEVLSNDIKSVKPKVIESSNSSNYPKKMLGISSDGAAVIRVKPQRLLKPEKQVHICDVCGNSYPRKYALDAHMRRHNDEKPFECEICGKAFHLNFQLTRHIRHHTGARPYLCQYCNRNFADRSSKIKHERIHRNERPYTCETCGKSFTYSNVLKVHMLTHTGEKSFVCGICGKRFSRSHHLRAHLETLQHQSDPRSKVLVTQIKREKGSFGGDY